MSLQSLAHDPINFMPYSEEQFALPASDFTYEELTDIYNQTRVDYIVPMPMNARRMKEYVTAYEVNLSASVVSFYDDQVTGIGMLGLRDNRAWITRLGVIPNGRGRKNGSFLMDGLIQQARNHNARSIQLEVISGNEPAHNLFHKYGFVETRDLSIVRHAPSLPQHENPLPEAVISTLTQDEIHECLKKRPPGASWVEETSSICKKGQLYGYQLQLGDDEHGWIVFHSSKFQMGHFVIDATQNRYKDIVLALLHRVHCDHSTKDTKVENVPVRSQLWHIYQQFGYIESFRRVEMLLCL